MKKEAKERWMAALRSGNYRQGRNSLISSDPSDGAAKYCCLGVLVEECEGKDSWQKTVVGDFVFRGNRFGVPENYKGLPDPVAARLMTMNDVLGYTFAEIADWIEENISED